MKVVFVKENSNECFVTESDQNIIIVSIDRYIVKILSSPMYFLGMCWNTKLFNNLEKDLLNYISNGIDKNLKVIEIIDSY